MYLPTTNLALARFHDQKTPIDSHPSYLPVIATSPDLICDWNLMGADSVQIQLRQLDCLVNSTDRQIPAVRPRITVVRCESNWMNKIAESSHPLRMQYWVGAGVTMRVVHWNGFSVPSIRVTDLNITTYAGIQK